MFLTPSSNFQYNDQYDEYYKDSTRSISPYRSTDNVQDIEDKVLTSEDDDLEYMSMQSEPMEPVQFVGARICISTPLHISCSIGDAEGLKTLLSCRAVKLDINIKNAEGLTPIQIACQHGDKECVQLLIENGADVNVKDKYKFTPLHYACSNGWIKEVQSLKARGANLDAKNETGLTPLLIAASQGHEECVQFLVDNGADVNVENEQKLTSLHYACHDGWIKVVQSLKERGANLDAKCEKGLTPLLIAARQKREECMQFLVDNGADVNVTENKQKFTPLHYACSKGWIGVVKSLKERGANLDAKTNEELTSLLIAVSHGHEECAKFLIDNGADVNVTENKQKFTPLHYACGKGWIGVIRSLKERGANLEAKTNEELTPLLIALAHGHEECAQFLVDNGADVNVTENKQKYTPLHCACSKGWIGVVRSLKERGANLDAKTNEELTPLSIASAHGHEECAQFLVDNGADVNVTENKQKYTPLHCACSKGWIGVVRSLKERGANLEAKTNEELTPLLIASVHGHEECAQFLINNGAEVNIENEQKYTPLHYACSEGWIKTVELLEEREADLDAKNEQGFTPLLLAMACRDDQCAKFLIESGANIDVSDEDGYNILHHACKNGWFDVIKLLKLYGVNVEATNQDGHTPLMVALSNGHRECVKFLIDSGSNVTDGEIDGFKVIHYACMHNWSDIVDSCLDKGEDINIKNINGDTPLNTALGNNNSALAEVLINKGASLDIENNSGKLSIHIACEKGLENIVGLLIAKKASLDVIDHTKATPLHLSIQGKYESCTRLLVDSGAKLTDEGDNLGNSHFSLLMKNLDTPYHRSLVSKILPNADLRKADSLGNIPLHYAVQYKDKELVDYMLSKLNPKDLLHKNIYGETAWTLSKDSTKWIDGLNPYEIALLETNPKIDSGTMRPEDLSTFVDAVVSKYGILAEESINEINGSHNICQGHLKYGVQKIPEIDLEIDLDDYLSIYDDLIARPEASIIPEKYRDREILDSLLDKITERTPFSGTPTNEDDLEIFYRPIESALAYVLHTLQTLEGDEAIKVKLETLRTILMEGEMCGGKISTMAFDLYHRVCLKEDINFRSMLFSKLAKMREYIIDASLPRHPQNIHDRNLIMNNLGVLLGIPGGEEAQRFVDPYSGHGVDIERVKNGFFRRYTPYYIADAIRKEINTEADFREKFIEFIEDEGNAISASSEWDEAFSELIKCSGQLSKDKSIKAIQEKILKTLEILNPGEEIDWKSTSEESSEIFMACQKLEVDMDVVFDVLESCEVID